MSFVYERKMPESDYSRFAGLREYRRQYIYRGQAWAVDRERDVCVVDCLTREDAHRPESLKDALAQKRYYLLCKSGEFFSIEGIRNDTSSEVDGHKAIIIEYSDTVLYLLEHLKGEEEYYYNIALEAINFYIIERYHRSYSLTHGGTVDVFYYCNSFFFNILH